MNLFPYFLNTCSWPYSLKIKDQYLTFYLEKSFTIQSLHSGSNQVLSHIVFRKFLLCYSSELRSVFMAVKMVLMFVTSITTEL